MKNGKSKHTMRFMILEFNKMHTEADFVTYATYAEAEQHFLRNKLARKDFAILDNSGRDFNDVPQFDPDNECYLVVDVRTPERDDDIAFESYDEATAHVDSLAEPQYFYIQRVSKIHPEEC